MAQIENNAKQTPDERQKANPQTPAIPKNLSDPEFAKLSFPKQPFMQDVGKSEIPGEDQKHELPNTVPVDLTKLFENKPASTQEDKVIQRETKDFKIEQTEIVKVVGEKETNVEVFNKLKLKKHDTEIQLKSPTEIARAEGIASVSNRTLDEIRKQTGNTPEKADFNSSLGYLEFKTGETNNIASPRFVLAEATVNIFAEGHQSKLKTLNEERIELKEILGELDTYDKISGEVRKAYEQIETIRSEYGIKRNYKEEDLKSLPVEVREKFISSNEKIKESMNLHQIEFYYQRINSEIEKLVKNFELSKTYQGQLSDGTKVVASYNSSENKIDIFDLQNNKLFEESLINHNSGFELSIKKQIEDNRYSVTEIALNDYSTIHRITEHHQYGKETKASQFSEIGELEKITYEEFGYTEEYKDGQISNISAWLPTRVFSYAAEVIKSKNATQVLTEAANAGGFIDLGTLKHFKNHKDAEIILEAGIASLHLTQIQEMREETENELKNILENKTSRKHQDLSKEDLENVKSLLEFRERMIVDGDELARNDNSRSNEREIGKLIFNDPSSRGYFEIKDEWIDWESNERKNLVNQENPDLSKKELKLLASRIVFNKREELSKESVNQALSDISSLRERFGTQEIFKERNIVLAAHEQILDREFTELSGDFHQFGKPALVEEVRRQQGNNGTFQLIRAENEIVQDINKLKQEISSQIKDPAISGKIIDAITESAKSNPSFTFDNARKILIENEVDYPTSGSIIENVAPTPREKNNNLIQKKSELLSAIATTPPPFTFVFDGHGGPDAIYLSDGTLGENLTPEEINSTIKITSNEFANALKQRTENFPANPNRENDLFVLQNCYNSNFVRAVTNEISNTNSIFIGASEYNQLSLIALPSPEGSLFLTQVVAGKDAEPINEKPMQSNINGIIDRQFNQLEQVEPFTEQGTEPQIEILNTNPSIYVPNESGETIQISGVLGELSRARGIV